MSPLLDTHAWIWWLQGDEGLTSRERASLDDHDNLERSVQFNGFRDDLVAATPLCASVVKFTPRHYQIEASWTVRSEKESSHGVHGGHGGFAVHRSLCRKS
jgi:hypothetical protein